MLLWFLHFLNYFINFICKETFKISFWIGKILFQNENEILRNCPFQLRNGIDCFSFLIVITTLRNTFAFDDILTWASTFRAELEIQKIRWESLLKVFFSFIDFIFSFSFYWWFRYLFLRLRLSQQSGWS